MMPDDLWGDVPAPGEVRTPISILREQADLISQKTAGLIKGRVVSPPLISGSSPQATLQLIVPNMNNYSYSIVTVTSDPVSIYPAGLLPAGDRAWSQAIDEEQFKVLLGAVLSSPRIKKALIGLQAQARQVEQKE
jgi:hypothetical protein